MFGIGGTEFLVILVVALIVFGPKDLPRAMRSAGAMMQTFNRMSGQYRRQFEQALRDVERELEVDETRKAVEAALKDPPAPTRSPPGLKNPVNDPANKAVETGQKPGASASKGSKDV